MKQALKNSLCEYGKQLKAIRLAIGLSQKAAAAEIGIDPANLCRIEKGQFNISLATLVNILQNYGWRMCFVVQADDFVKSVDVDLPGVADLSDDFLDLTEVIKIDPSLQ